MTGVVRGDGIDTVNTVHPAVGGDACDASPITTSTDQCSSMVIAGDYGVVRQSDTVRPHTFPGCATHAPGLTTYHPNVIVEGLGIARQGDQYGCGATITSSSSDIMLGG